LRGATTAAILHKQVYEPLPDPKNINPDLSDGIARLIGWMMKKDRDRRPQNCADLVAGIGEVERTGNLSGVSAPLPMPGPGGAAATGKPVAAALSKPDMGHEATLPPPSSPRRVFWSAVGSAVAVLLAVFLVLVGLAVLFKHREVPKEYRPTYRATEDFFEQHNNLKPSVGQEEQPASRAPGREPNNTMVLPKGWTKEAQRTKVGTPQGDKELDITHYTNTIGMKFVYIPPGEFRMGGRNGLDNEKPVHRVRTTRGFYLGMCEVTQGQYEAVVGKNPSHFRGAANPVEAVSWNEAVEFCRKLSRKTGETYRLPTEAEWEYACRAGAVTKYAFGDSDEALDEYAWHSGNSGGKTHAVGGRKPNAFGLYDMHGNVREWCADCYDKDYYANSPEEDPSGPATGKSRVLRGGCWDYVPGSCRSGLRSRVRSDFSLNNLGFRLVLLPRP